MSRETNISKKALSTCARKASVRAVKKAKASNVAYTVQQGRSIVQHSPDGTTEVVGMLSKARVKPAAKRYRVA
jgi:hypothetical protein